MSKRPPDQRKFLDEKFTLYLKHHGDKSLGQFYPSLYAEYFDRWPPIPTAEGIDAVSGDVAVATAKLRRIEEIVSTYLIRPNDFHTNQSDDQKLYRWMDNHRRSKRGPSGEGSSANLNLTAGPPKKKAAVQTYVKQYWEAKIKQEVISKWAPTPETDLFDEADIGEDQVGWESMTPMEKNIPLWFRMEVGREMYEAESDEVKEEINRLREKEKDDVVTSRTSISSANMFASERERLRAMNKFDT